MDLRVSIARLFWCVLVALFNPSLNLAAQTMRENADAFDKPNGKSINAKLSVGSNVTVTRRDGFWIEVSVAGKSGWVKASQVTFSSPGGSVAIDTGRLGGGNIVSTSAARGLSAKDLLSGQPNFNDVIRMESIRVDAKDVQAFELAGNLKPPLSNVRLTSPSQPKLRNSNAGEGGGPHTTSANSGKKKNADDW